MGDQGRTIRTIPSPVNMEQADYERDSETEEEENPPSLPPPSLPLEKRPKSKAMPTQPSVPPLKLTLKVKAQPKNIG